jgi:uncharacterized protein YndB with AHSA1/START domain
MALEKPPVVKVQLLIRKPAAEVFEAFVNPTVTTRFWFSKSSGQLAPGKTVRWEWQIYGAAADVHVITIEPDKRIVIEWGDPPRPVEWLFDARPNGTTLVSISEHGFRGTDDQIVAQAIDSTGGFTSVLAGLKAWLEHGIALNLVADHRPDVHQH